MDSTTKHPAILALRFRDAISASGPWRHGVLDFSGETYTDNFGRQWKQFDRTQLDSANQDTLSRDRLLMTLGLTAEELRGKLVLEAGSGAGRFTEQLLAMGAVVVTFDSSEAVQANAAQNANSRALFMRASIYGIPTAPGQFDIVICLGVLQHTPDRRRTVAALAEQVKPGGLLCVDSYRFSVRRLLPSYLMRPVWSRLSAVNQQRLARGYVAAWWPLRRIFRARWARALAWALSPIAPVCYYWAVSANKSDAYLREWAELETHDFLSPRHDMPQTERTFRRILARAGLAKIEVEDLSKARTSDGRTVSGFYAGRARAPA